MNAPITVLIHGTFANKLFETTGSAVDEWWKRTDATSPRTAADRLNAQLNTTCGAVWYPNDSDQQVTYRDLVEWDSLNKHKSRKRAGARLATALGNLATLRGCTKAEPLRVNFVAHSHGGNVVLEALGQLPDNVVPRQVSLLGTPILWRYTDPRFVYLSVIFAFVVGWFWVLWGQIRDPQGLTGDNSMIESWPEFIVFEILFAAVMFWAASGVILLIRAIVQRVLAGRPAYGPKPERLLEILGGRPAVLFISKEDEADLMMRMGAAPIDAYRALLRGRPVMRGVGPVRKIVFFPVRVIEVIMLRPMIYVVLAPLLEVMLERFGLGFPLRSTLIHNYEMISWSFNDKYEGAIKTRSLDADLLYRDAQMSRLSRHARSSIEVAPSETPIDPLSQLRDTFLEAVDGLRHQVHLSHSDYYESPRILELVAHEINGVDGVSEF